MRIDTPETGALRRVLVAPMRSVEVRDTTGTGDGSWTIGGYAAVFNQETTLYDGAYSRVREVVAPGAFSRVLTTDPLVHLNFGHDMQSAIASTHVRAAGGALPVGGLELAEDEHGLRFFARVDATDPDAIRLAAKMRAGVVDQASFAFTIRAEDEFYSRTDDGRDDALYTIREVGDLYDVCACAQGAYPQTTSFIRSVYRASFSEAFDEVAAHPRGAASIAPLGAGASDHVASGGGSVSTTSTAAQLAKLRARARRSRLLIDTPKEA